MIQFTIDERATCIYVIGKISGDDETLSLTRSLYEKMRFSDDEMKEGDISLVDNGIYKWKSNSNNNTYEIELTKNECNQLKAIMMSWRGWTHETWDAKEILKSKLNKE